MGEAKWVIGGQTPALKNAEVHYIFFAELVYYAQSFFPVFRMCQNCWSYFINPEMQGIRSKKTLVMIFQICLVFECEETELALILVIYIPVIQNCWRVLTAREE